VWTSACRLESSPANGTVEVCRRGDRKNIFIPRANINLDRQLGKFKLQFRYDEIPHV